MKNDFPRNITFLRKERGISQKQAAADLGISQSLLSHYEKGIRECGMDFLCKAADYYEVTTDYLLGRTVQRGSLPDSSLPESDDFQHIKGNMMIQINRRLLNNTSTIIFDLLAQLGNKRLTNAVSNYLMCAEYQAFRAIYSAGASNTQTMFSLSQKNCKPLCTASMIMQLETVISLLEDEKLSLNLSPDILSGYYEQGVSSLFNLIQFAERSVKNSAMQTGANL